MTALELINKSACMIDIVVCGEHTTIIDWQMGYDNCTYGDYVDCVSSTATVKRDYINMDVQTVSIFENALYIDVTEVTI